MNKQIKALEESINHWERMATNNRVKSKYEFVMSFPYDSELHIKTGGMEMPGTADCACCNIWWENLCKGCPIMEYTGFNFCNDTPYIRIEEVFDSMKKPFGSKTFAKHAQKEIDFLKEVLEWVKAGKPEHE